MLWRDCGRWRTFLACFRQPFNSRASADSLKFQNSWRNQAQGRSMATLGKAAQKEGGRSVRSKARSREEDAVGHTPRPAQSVLSALRKETKEFPMELMTLIERLFAAGVSQQIAAQTIHRIRHSPEWVSLLKNAEMICRVAEDLAATDAPHRPRRLMHIACKVGGARFTLSQYERVAFRLAMAKRWQHITPLVDLAKRWTGTTSVRLLNWRTRAAIETEDYASLGKVLDQFSAAELSPTRRTFHLIIQGHLRNHDVSSARAVMAAMEEMSVPKDPTTYAAVVAVYRGLGPDPLVEDRAYDILAEIGPPTGTTVLNSLLQLYLDQGEMRSALHVLGLFARRTQEALSGASSTAANGDSGAQNVRSRPQTTFLPDVATFTILVSSLSKQRDIKWLDKIMEQMKSAGIVPDSTFAASLIRAYYAHNMEEAALKVVRDICRPLTLDDRLLCAIGDQGTVGLSLAFVGDPTVEVFNALLEGAMKKKGIKVARFVLHMMRLAHVLPDSVTLEIFLYQLERRERMASRDVIVIMNKLLHSGIQPTLRHAHIMLRSIVLRQKRAVQREGWNALSSHVKMKVLSPNSQRTARDTATSAPMDPLAGLPILHSGPFRKLMWPLIKSLSVRGVKSDRKTFALRMRRDIYANSPGEGAASVQRIFQTMVSRGMHPSAHHIAPLMEAHCAAGDMSAARAVMLDAQRRKAVHPTARVVLHTVLIAGYVRTGRPDLALRTFQEMLRADIQPDTAAVDTVVSGFFAVGAYSLARRVLLDLWPMVSPFPEELKDESLKTMIRRFRELGAEPEASYVPPTRRALLMQTRKIVALWRRMSSGKTTFGLSSQRSGKSTIGTVSHPRRKM